MHFFLDLDSITSIANQQLWGYKVEEKLHWGGGYANNTG
jgi:hypothetical protein